MNDTLVLSPTVFAASEFEQKFQAAWDHLEAKRYSEAVRAFKEIEARQADYWPLQAGLGHALTCLGRLDAAEKYLRSAAQSEARWSRYFLPLAQRLRARGEGERCVALLQEAIRLNPRDTKAIIELANIFRGRRQLHRAAEILATAVALENDNVELALEYVILLAQQEKFPEALERAEALLQLGTVQARVFDVWCELMRKSKRGDELLARLEALTKSHPEQFALWAALGLQHAKEGRPEQALAAYQRAAEIKPDSARAHLDIAVSLRFLGRIEESTAGLERALALEPQLPNALRVLGQDHKYVYGDRMFARLNSAAAHLPELNPHDQSQIIYALAKAFDDVGELDTAFEYYKVAGQIMRRLHPWPERESARLQSSLSEHINADTLKKFAGKGFADERPVFVLGMPRSGTSLLEQVLSSHPRVFGAGELKLMGRILQGIRFGRVRFDLQQMDSFWSLDEVVDLETRGRRYVEEVVKLAPPTALRIVDKMPGNYVFSGMIALVLPKARIIHSRRHPVETCLSQYRIRFVEGHQWSYDLAQLGRQYVRYDKIMRHWRSVLPSGYMLEVRYEDMVRDLETQARRIIEFLGLPWDDTCLRFHETDRPVRTASASQVRKPIYTTSMNRWRKYEPYLKPLLEELGALVPEYEAEVEAAAATVLH